MFLLKIFQKFSTGKSRSNLLDCSYGSFSQVMEQLFWLFKTYFSNVTFWLVSIESRVWRPTTCLKMLLKMDYTTIQRMTIPRLTKWRPDFDILMIQRLFFFWKKKAKIFFLPLTGFTWRLFLPLTGARKDLHYPSQGFSTPDGSWFLV